MFINRETYDVKYILRRPKRIWYIRNLCPNYNDVPSFIIVSFAVCNNSKRLT